MFLDYFFRLALIVIFSMTMIQPVKAEGLVPIENWGNVQWSGEIMWDVSAKAGNCAAAKEAAVNASLGSAPQPSAVIGQQGPGTPYGPHFHVGGTGLIDYYYNWQAPWDPPGVLFTSVGRVYTQAGQSCSTKCPLMSDNPDANGMCTCNPGFQPDASGVQCTAIAPPTCPAAGANFSDGYYDVGTDPNANNGAPPLFGCDGGCKTQYEGSSFGWRVQVQGIYHYFAKGAYVHTGETCSTGAPSVGVMTTVPSVSCAAGQSLVTGANGFKKCYNDMTGTYVDGNSASAIESAATLEQKRIADALGRIASAVAAAGGNASAVADAQQGWLGAGGGAGATDATGAEDPVQAAFCADNPTASICAEQDFGSVETANLGTKSINVAINPVTVGGAGSCPSPSSITIHGQTKTFDWTTYCNFATGIKPILLAFAWLAAAGILIGGFRSS